MKAVLRPGRIFPVLLGAGLLIALFRPPGLASQSESATLRFAIIAADDTPTVIDEAYPRLTLEVTPVDRTGLPLRGLNPSDFSIQVDGAELDRLEVVPAVEADQPVSILILFEASEEMAGQVEELRVALVGFYEAIEQTDESGLMAFGFDHDGSTVDLGEPFPRLNPDREISFTNDEGALLNLVNAVRPAGRLGSPLNDALLKGVRLTTSQARHPRRAIVLIATGFDRDPEGNVPGSNVADAAIVLEEARQWNIPIFTVAAGPDADTTYLRGLSDGSGGHHYRLDNNLLVSQVLSEVVSWMKLSYVLRVEATSFPDDVYHTLSVRLASQAGEAEASTQFRARYPPEPLVRRVLMGRAGQSPIPHEQIEQVRGSVLIQPEVVARGTITAINYYVDDDQTAVYSATEAPWSFRWQTEELAPGKTHSLLLEILDDANPPHVGRYVITVPIQACPFSCVLEQSIGFNPLYLLVLAGLAILAAAFLLYWRVRASGSEFPAATAGQPNGGIAGMHDFPGAATAVEHVPGKPHGQSLSHAPTVVESTPAEMDLLRYDPDTVAFLHDPHRGTEIRLYSDTTIGCDGRNDVVLESTGLDRFHARITLEDTRYVVIATTATGETRVNERIVRRQILDDGDRLQFGSHIFLFRQFE